MLDVYPALALVPRDLFGICVVGTGGRVFAVGDAEYEFSIMSVSKPFVFALVCQALGAEQAAREARGEQHRPAVQLARRHRAERRRPNEPDGERRARSRPRASSRADRRRQVAVIHDGLSPLRRPRRSRSTRRSTSRPSDDQPPQPGHRPPARGYGRLYSDPAEATDLYTRQCSLASPRRTSP